jgi:AcrR family transcriptional regulator
MPRWEPNPRVRLVESALELFEEQGYDETGVTEIAQRAGLTKTTFFRHFPDKREVLFAGQEAHSELLAHAVADAPSDATPLQMVKGALDALAATQPLDRHAFNARWRAVVGAHSELQEREALKYAGYLAAISDALRRRSIPEATAAVAADLGILAFKIAFTRWAQSTLPPALPDLVHATLDEIHAASTTLR